jgi:hypothetical protein
VLPQGIAYAAIAGLPPEYGLYCAIGPAIVAALFGSSWHLVSGPTAAISIVVFSALSPLAAPGSPQYVTLALTLGLLVGAIQLTLGIVRLGPVDRPDLAQRDRRFTAGRRGPDRRVAAEAYLRIAAAPVHAFFRRCSNR